MKTGEKFWGLMTALNISFGSSAVYYATLIKDRGDYMTSLNWTAEQMQTAFQNPFITITGYKLAYELLGGLGLVDLGIGILIGYTIVRNYRNSRGTRLKIGTESSAEIMQA